MNTIIEKINENNISIESIQRASAILERGGLVAFPTETVYGLGGDGLSALAATKIYTAKGRPSDNPLIIHVAEIGTVYDLAEDINDHARMLMEAFWPGPLTIIFNKKDHVPGSTTGGLSTVAIRMPSHPVALALIKESGLCIAAPSANTSGRPSPTCAQHVIEDLVGKVEMIIDGGAVGIGIESTIIDVTGELPIILRPGYITKAMLEQVIGEVVMDRALEEVGEEIKPKAPGMKYTHYAPKGELTIVEARVEKKQRLEEQYGVLKDTVSYSKIVSKINKLAAAKMAEGFKVGIIATEDNAKDYKADLVINIGAREDALTVSAKLYGVLREFDHEDIEYIFSESFSNDDFGYAIMNRLIKAAGHRMIYV